MSAHESLAVQDSNLAGAWEKAVQSLLDDPTAQQLARDCYFDGSAVKAAERYWASLEWRAVRPLLPETAGSALDVGAGRGIASYAMARDGWSVYALEPDGSALVGAGAIQSMVRETGFPIEVHQAFGESLPFQDGQFDVVFARQALHHARNLPGLVRELYRVLRPGGRLVAIRDHVITRPEDLKRFFDIHPLHRLYGGENAYLLDDYVRAIEGAGFSLRSRLAPFQSPINYAPLQTTDLPEAIAGQLPAMVGIRGFVAGLLRLPGALQLALKVLALVDNRPGRLYSFVAMKPVG